MIQFNFDKRRLEQNGFTLVELIVVILIISVLIGVTVAGITHYIHKSRVNMDINNSSTMSGALSTMLLDEDILTVQSSYTSRPWSLYIVWKSDVPVSSIPDIYIGSTYKNRIRNVVASVDSFDRVSAGSTITETFSTREEAEARVVELSGTGILCSEIKEVYPDATYGEKYLATIRNSNAGGMLGTINSYALEPLSSLPQIKKLDPDQYFDSSLWSLNDDQVDYRYQGGSGNDDSKNYSVNKGTLRFNDGGWELYVDSTWTKLSTLQTDSRTRAQYPSSKKVEMCEIVYLSHYPTYYQGTSRAAWLWEVNTNPIQYVIDYGETSYEISYEEADPVSPDPGPSGGGGEDPTITPSVSSVNIGEKIRDLFPEGLPESKTDDGFMMEIHISSSNSVARVHCGADDCSTKSIVDTFRSAIVADLSNSIADVSAPTSE